MNLVRLVARLGFCAAVVPTVAMAETMSPPLIPLPAQLSYTDGAFHVDAHTPVVLVDHEASMRRTADYLVGLMDKERGLHLQVEERAASPPALVRGTSLLTLTNQASSGDLHYTLDGSARTVASRFIACR